MEPYQNFTPKINVKLEKNSKGYNWEITVTNHDTVESALKLLKDADDKLRKQYGENSQ